MEEGKDGGRKTQKEKGTAKMDKRQRRKTMRMAVRMCECVERQSGSDGKTEKHRDGGGKREKRRE